MEIVDRFRGCLLGLAVGDAMGTTVEGYPRGSFDHIADMYGGGKYRLIPGQWTDDTSMALCLAESLIEQGAFDPMDQGHRYWRWYQNGHLASTGHCFDVGMTIRSAVTKFNPVPDPRRHDEPPRPFPGSMADYAAGNGSLMRLAPVPLFLHKYPEVALDLSMDSSKVTHGADAATDACRYFAGLLLGCLQGVSKEELLSPCYCPLPNHYEEHPLVAEIDTVAKGSFKTPDADRIKATGYVVKSMEAAMWAFYHTDNFKDGLIKVVNLGNDADTSAAIYGQLAGAYYGVDNIPEEWRKKCFFSSLIFLFADELYRSSLSISEPPPMSVLESTYLRGVQRYAGEDLILVVYVLSAVSLEYRNKKMLGYDQIEQDTKDIVRRQEPCPREFKTVDDFEGAVEEVRARYLALPPEAQMPELLANFEKRWDRGKENFLMRHSRPYW